LSIFSFSLFFVISVTLKKSLFAVFDGHAGDYTSRYLERHFASCFENIISTRSKTSKKSENDVKVIESSLRDACLTMNENLAQDPKMRAIMIRGEEMKKTDEKERLPTLDDAEKVELYLPSYAKKSFEGDKKAEHPMDGSGACGVVVVVSSTHIVVAHVGDCRCVVQHRSSDSVTTSGGNRSESNADNTNSFDCGLIKTLTNDHTCLNRKDEKDRVEKAGGFVNSGGRIFTNKKFEGESREPSRSWGDFLFMKHGIICLPEITITEREPNRTELIVLGCDGIFEGMNRNDKTIVSCLLNINNGHSSITRAQQLAQQSGDTVNYGKSSSEKKKGNYGLPAVSITQSPSSGEISLAPSTPQNRISSLILQPTSEEVCHELKEGCERVMLHGLDNGCMDNQTMCVALLRPAVLKHV
jgi:serine/threonine protein phosphatase PrpC